MCRVFQAAVTRRQPKAAMARAQPSFAHSASVRGEVASTRGCQVHLIFIDLMFVCRALPRERWGTAATTTPRTGFRDRFKRGYLAAAGCSASHHNVTPSSAMWCT